MSNEKMIRLQEALRGMGSVAIAFSGGVDSTFLLHVAHSALGGRAMAVTVRSRLVPQSEMDDATEFCRRNNIHHEILDFDIASQPEIAANPPDRCYHCKKAIFRMLLEFARSHGLAEVAEGSNTDDDGDYRPGHRAIAELGVRSPLRKAGLSKAEIRALSRELGLPTWDKPSFACLASRFPYGERITKTGLERVERAEKWLRGAGFGLAQLRVRSHGDVARIEVPPGDIPRLAARAGEIAGVFKKIGFTYATLDLAGYRVGSMNETLQCNGKAALE